MQLRVLYTDSDIEDVSNGGLAADNGAPIRKI